MSQHDDVTHVRQSIFKQIIRLKRSQFVQLLNEFNETIETFTRDEPFGLRFTIVPRTDSTVIWKALIRITCSKVRREDDSIAEQAVVNFHQFLSIHQSVTQQILIFNTCSPPSLYNSTSRTNGSSSSLSTGKLSITIPNDNECCICMDRAPNLVLPCTHIFCDECFRQWSAQASTASSQTCPICREDIDSDSGYILAERPKYDCMKRTLTDSILSLPIDYKTRANSYRRHSITPTTTSE